MIDFRMLEKTFEDQYGLIGDFCKAIDEEDLAAMINWDFSKKNIGSSHEQALILDRINAYQPVF